MILIHSDWCPLKRGHGDADAGKRSCEDTGRRQPSARQGEDRPQERPALPLSLDFQTRERRDVEYLLFKPPCLAGCYSGLSKLVGQESNPENNNTKISVY